MTHRPRHEYNLWKEAKDNKRAEYHAKKQKNKDTGSTHGASTGTTTGYDAKKTLKLFDKMKAVLMTKFNCSEDDDKGLVRDICLNDQAQRV